MNYFKPLDIPNLDVIVNELLIERPLSNNTESRSFNYSDSVDKFPTLINWVELISNVPLHKFSTVKIFVTSPKSMGLLHIDHESTSRIGLNIPILNCQGTRFDYYETPDSNLTVNIGEKSKGYGISLKPVNFKLLTPGPSLELTSPHLIRTDKLHRAFNNTVNTRVIATVRWEANRHLTEFEDFVNVL